MRSFEHFATISFLSILFQLVSFRNSVSDQQAANIAQFFLAYSDSLLHGNSVEVLRLSLQCVKILIIDKWHFLSADVQYNLLKVLFFDGICVSDPESVKISIDAVTEAHRFLGILEFIDEEFRYHAFAAICSELCACSNTMMRDHMVDFVVFFCAAAPNFRETLLVPFIEHLPVRPDDSAALIGCFAAFQTESDFKKLFVDFCDDVAYLLPKGT
jgi:hypothetical protein